MFEVVVRAVEPDNIHPLPIAEAWDGTHWTVDIQVRLPCGIDLDGSGVDVSQRRARAKALQRIRKTVTMYRKYGHVPN